MLKNTARDFLIRYRFPLLVGLGLRIATSLWIAFVWLFLDPQFPRTAQAIRETYNHLPFHESIVGRMFLGAWLRWDAVHYMNLAWGGYANAGIQDTNFWPLYPLLVRMASYLTIRDFTASGLLISTLATLACMVLLWELVRTLFGDDSLANGSVTAWAVYPTSFLLVAPYSDSLYACLALGTLLAVAQKKWLLSGLLAGLAGLARSQAILLLVPIGLGLALEWYQDRRDGQRQFNLLSVASLALAPLGNVGYQVWKWQNGLPDIFAGYGQYSQIYFVGPFVALYMAAVRLVQQFSLLQFTELFSLVFSLVILTWMLTRAQFRRQIPLMSYGIVTLGLLISKYDAVGSPLRGSNRYALNVLPVFIGLGWLLLKLPPKTRRWVIFSSAIGGMIACTLYAMWIFVG